MADMIKGEMIRGHIDTVILLALTDGDKDSNEIRLTIEEKSDNQYSVKQGTFYSAMQRLVKQGYIKEYRSSAIDGIRRKYYSLNTKGKTFLDKNREQWQASKNLVDNLMDTESVSLPKEPEPVQNTVDEFESFKIFAQDIGDFSVEQPIQDNSYFDKLGDEVLKDLNEELEKIAKEEEILVQEESLPYEEISENQISTVEENSNLEDFEIVANKTIDTLYDFENIESETGDFIDPILLNEDTAEEFTEEIVETPIEETIEEPIEENQIESLEKITEEILNSNQLTVEENEPISEVKITEQVSEKEEKSPIFTNEKDDLLIIEEGKPTNRREYKQILNRLFPQNEEKQVEKKEDCRQMEFVSYTETYENKREEKVIDNTPAPAPVYEEEPIVRKPVKKINGDPSDFSDLYAMASREGFKIKTSHNTNKYNGNEILVNKLRLHSSLLFYLFIFIECLILDFALGSILNWDINVKLIILGALALYPAVTILMYLLNAKKSVYEIAQFKDAVSIALIVTFQLAIIILCVALFVSVDFNNFKEVSTYILLPIILAINIPLYFILKYSLLSTGKYFTD